ncbi:MAG: YegS/Rv2252/BmrU family lipid kinase [Bacteroidales bacterium]|nr:YegS/Rv2252/BmrU family lipid kinase [Bacteroidales bacterium]
MTSEHRLMLIVNPASGSVAKHKIVPEIYRRMKALGLNFEISFTAGQGHARELARQAAADGYYAVLACGGDGTVNEIASGLIGTDTVMGIIPTGSGNGLARHLSIPVDVARSLAVIAEDNVITADYGTANASPFFCTFGVGFDAAVSERCARQKRRGVIMYLRNTIEEYAKFSPEEYVIEANGQVITEKAFLVVCCNASQYGNNAFIAPGASVTDGELDITIVHSGNLLSHAILGVDMLTGFIGKNALVSTIRCKSATIRRKTSGAAHLDGDAVAMPEVIEVNCHPAQLRVFVPTRLTRFRPLVTPISLFFRDLGLGVRRILHLN